MGAMEYQFTSLTISYSGRDLKKQSSASLAFVRGIHRRPENSPHKWPVTRKMFPFDYGIMIPRNSTIEISHSQYSWPHIKLPTYLYRRPNVFVLSIKITIAKERACLMGRHPRYWL